MSFEGKRPRSPSQSSSAASVGRRSRFSAPVANKLRGHSCEVSSKERFCVIVGDLPLDTSGSEVRVLVSELRLTSGNLVSVDVIRSGTEINESSTCAVVQFDTFEAAQDAVVALRSVRLRGRTLETSLAPAARRKRADETSSLASGTNKYSTSRKTSEESELRCAAVKWGPAEVDSAGTSSQDAATKFAPTLDPSGALQLSEKEVFDNSEYKEPYDSTLPLADDPWRLYVFKNGSLLDEESNGIFVMNTRNHYLFGRDRIIAHIPIDHSSCSKQHAVLQFRRSRTKDSHATTVCPYIFDLDSRNGTFLNFERLPGRTYVEIKSGDVLTFGASTREWVVIRESRPA